MSNKKQHVLIDGSSLPEDLIFFEIFARLPVKSLLRFRWVSKFCRSLTTHPEFLAAVRLRNRRRYILSFSASMHWQRVFYSVDPEPQYSSVESHAQIIDYKNPNYCSYVKFINGLMCFVLRNDVVIRNDATKEEFRLPQFRSPPPWGKSYFYFCYDPETDKYKVLRTTVAWVNIGGNVVVSDTSYSIFTLGKDKLWRVFNAPELYQLGNSKSVCINGILYCTNFSTRSNVNDGVICAFVVKSEFYYNVGYPEGLSPSRYKTCHLIEVKGALAVVDVEKFCIIRLWIRVNGPGSESWMEHRIEFDSRWETIFRLASYFSFTSNRDGEIAMGSSGMSTRGISIFRYNLETGKWRRIEVVGVKERVIMGDFYVEEYVETPLLLRQILNL